MALRRKVIGSYFWCIAALFLFLPAGSADSFAQSSLPFQLSVREKNPEGFPCQDCHQDLPTKSGNDEAGLEEHAQISFKHGGLRCLDCHDSEDRNTLRTIGQRRVDFSSMEEMCGGCHASDYRDWKQGIHGKLLGSWNGTRLGLRCVECHDVHKPKPMTLKPEPAPHPRRAETRNNRQP